MTQASSHSSVSLPAASYLWFQMWQRSQWESDRSQTLLLISAHIKTNSDEWEASSGARLIWPVWTSPPDQVQVSQGGWRCRSIAQWLGSAFLITPMLLRWKANKWAFSLKQRVFLRGELLTLLFCSRWQPHSSSLNPQLAALVAFCLSQSFSLKSISRGPVKRRTLSQRLPRSHLSCEALSGSGFVRRMRFQCWWCLVRCCT